MLGEQEQHRHPWLGQEARAFPALNVVIGRVPAVPVLPAGPAWELGPVPRRRLRLAGAGTWTGTEANEAQVLHGSDRLYSHEGRIVRRLRGCLSQRVVSAGESC